ncbi:aminotransferase class V-fold PLP-dependent enzyme [Sphingomonas sp.]|uniref:aminotransferase class V-fold PLP-dependent enzyme n=1 Tax=Sphingomonas sp. TaxID=28214 RepID=UPI0025CBF3E3|nr:aminotransferase class V-fold PLP-dependent enzyme [Sphingomonas sp.]
MLDVESAVRAPLGVPPPGWAPVERADRVARLGASARDLWWLEKDAIHLNHGGYGACPRIVGYAQDIERRRIETQPDLHFATRVMPGSIASRVREAAAALARFVGAEAGRIALVENATSGIEAVLRSMPFKAGDRILLTNHHNSAVLSAVERRCRETGAQPTLVSLPIPLKPGQVLDTIETAIHRHHPALAIIDHITAPTAIRLPVRAIAHLLHDYEVPILVDGTHAPGQIALDLRSIRADWYVGDAHTWLYAPRGTAFLHCAPHAPNIPRPPVTGQAADWGFPQSFDYIGTRDYSAWAALPAALQFWQRMDAAGLDAHCAKVLEDGSVHLERIGLVPAAPAGCSAFMRSFILPQRGRTSRAQADQLKETLWRTARIQANSFAFGDKLLLRLCAQAYVEPDEVAALADVLDRRGWPGR